MQRKIWMSKYFKLETSNGIYCSFMVHGDARSTTQFNLWKTAFRRGLFHLQGSTMSKVNEFKMFPASAHMSDQDIDDWYNAWKEQLVLEKEIKLPSDGQNGEKNQEKPQKKGRL